MYKLDVDIGQFMQIYRDLLRSISLSRGVNIIDGTAESLPVGNNTYDFALLVTTDCFLDAPKLTFIEVYRILKAGGSIIIGLIDKNSIFRLFR